MALDDILKILENNNHDLSGEYADIEPQETIVYVTPPVDGDITAEYSGGEEDVTLANLPGSQLLSPAIQGGMESDIESTEPIKTRKSSITKRSKKKVRHWSENDLHFDAPDLQYPFAHLQQKFPANHMKFLNCFSM